MLKIFLSLTIFSFILLTFSLFIFHPANITLTNKTNGNICISNVKLGSLDHLKGEQVRKNESKSFFNIFSSSNKLSVAYREGQCGADDNLMTTSCVLDRKGSDACVAYLNDDGSLNCSECYK